MRSSVTRREERGVVAYRRYLFAAMVSDTEGEWLVRLREVFGEGVHTGQVVGRLPD